MAILAEQAAMSTPAARLVPSAPAVPDLIKESMSASSASSAVGMTILVAVFLANIVVSI
jgi:hypothetical protein